MTCSYGVASCDNTNTSILNTRLKRIYGTSGLYSIDVRCRASEDARLSPFWKIYASQVRDCSATRFRMDSCCSDFDIAKPLEPLGPLWQPYDMDTAGKEWVDERPLNNSAQSGKTFVIANRLKRLGAGFNDSKWSDYPTLARSLLHHFVNIQAGKSRYSPAHFPRLRR